MDPARALADLKEISSQIEAAALVGSDGAVIASSFEDEGAAGRFVETARALLAAAEEVPSPGSPLVQLEVATLDGSVFVVRDSDRSVVATTRPEPTVGLVFYDLKTCLRSAAAPGTDDGKPRPRPAEASEPEATEAGEDDSAA
jgi:predicted regulator of Ras-like GTPase activity (Roadblock/LC7/MglB family)